MVVENTLVKDVEAYVLGMLRENLSKDITYHSTNHTKEVVRCVNEIAEKENFTEDEVEIVNIAAWFHDTGYTISAEDHETHGASICRSFLKKLDYPQEKAVLVEGCILATQMPQCPTNALEKCLCDADLMHLADKDYFKKADLLHKEIEKTKLCTIPEREWMQMNQEFLKSHCFFTDYAHSTYTAAVKENLRKVRERLKKWQKAKK